VVAFAVAAVVVDRLGLSVGAEEQIGRGIHGLFNFVPCSKFYFSLAHGVVGNDVFAGCAGTKELRRKGENASNYNKND